MWTQAKPLKISRRDRQKLERWTQALTTPIGIVQRAQIVLMAADGRSNNAIAKKLGVSRPMVILWRNRFEQEGADALADIKRPSTRPDMALPTQMVDAIVDATLHRKPAGATHWSCRSMAKEFGVGAASIQRIWNSHGLKPHRIETFKLSTDRRFREKLTDVVGLYLNPPDKAIVLCVDEKSQIQALDRSQPGLPMKRGRCGTMTHDYRRHGTTSLFAALDIAEGTVIGQCYGRHRHQEFLKFLNHLDTQYPDSVDLHLIVDNYGTHAHPAVQRWLKRHPRFKLHFTPTSSSWLNLVERWFRELTEKSIRRGIFGSVAELVENIRQFIATYNNDPKPFVWTASARSIIRKVNRCKAVAETLH
ncbi:MAG: IS630 family transposase [Candidatus Tumulicola sp.]